MRKSPQNPYPSTWRRKTNTRLGIELGKRKRRRKKKKKKKKKGRKRQPNAPLCAAPTAFIFWYVLLLRPYLLVI
jgi:hypothetical protein